MSNHFNLLVILSALISLVFTFIVKYGAKERVKYFFFLFCSFVLYLLMFRALHEGSQPRPRRGGYWLAMILTVLYGISDELHQSFVPTRDSSVIDVLSDSVGALLGILALVVFQRVISSRQTRAS
jgi:VanZ family protein